MCKSLLSVIRAGTVSTEVSEPSGTGFAESMAVPGDGDQYSGGDLLVIDPNSNRPLTLP